MKRISPRIAIFGLLFLGGFTYKMFFVDTDEVIKFNNKIIDMLTKGDSKFNNISSFMDLYYAGEEINVLQMETAQKQLSKTTKDDLNNLNSMEVPDNPTCKSFHQICLDYVKNSNDIAEKYTEVISFIKKHNPGTEEDMTQFSTILQELLDKDEKISKEIDKKQQQLAKEFNFKLE